MGFAPSARPRRIGCQLLRRGRLFSGSCTASSGRAHAARGGTGHRTEEAGGGRQIVAAQNEKGRPEGRPISLPLAKLEEGRHSRRPSCPPPDGRRFRPHMTAIYDTAMTAEVTARPARPALNEPVVADVA